MTQNNVLIVLKIIIDCITVLLINCFEQNFKKLLSLLIITNDYTDLIMYYRRKLIHQF